MPVPDAITRAEAATLLGIDKSTVRKYERNGRLPAASFQTKPGSVQHVAFYSKTAVLELKARLEVEALNRRSEKQRQRDFEESLVDQEKHDALIAREDAAYELARAEQHRKRIAEQERLAAEQAARFATERQHAALDRLSRQNRELLRQQARDESESRERNLQLLGAAIGAITLAAGVWAARSADQAGQEAVSRGPADGSLSIQEQLEIIRAEIERGHAGVADKRVRE